MSRSRLDGESYHEPACQWCRHAIRDALVAYAAKVYHTDCFLKLKQVAGNTGGVL